jgi:uncharacterized glyoxalase superfamily protein PhnB
MTDMATVSSEVEVGVDPGVAFTAFTEEMDLWWVRGPINFSDAGRVVEVRCEPGVGGRIGEVLDDRATGPMRETARITVWEPGVRLCWASSVDDVQTEVRFEPTATGTRVVVEHRIPAGGEDRGGTAWSRVVPIWFGPWCARRDRVPHEPRDIARLALGVYYVRPGAAARWLADVFGFTPTTALPSGPDPLPEGSHGAPWIEFRVGDASLMIFRREGGPEDEPSQQDEPARQAEWPAQHAGGPVQHAGGPVHVPWVYVDDLDAHLAHAEQAGATILHRKEWPWLPSYVAEDLEGNRWTFAQARPTQRG